MSTILSTDPITQRLFELGAEVGESKERLARVESNTSNLISSFREHKEDTREDFKKLEAALGQISTKMDNFSDFKAAETGKSDHSFRWISITAMAASILSIIINFTLPARGREMPEISKQEVRK